MKPIVLTSILVVCLLFVWSQAKVLTGPTLQGLSKIAVNDDGTIIVQFVHPFSALDDKIEMELDKHREDLAKGNWIFPPLDPFNVGEFETSYEKKIANLTVLSKEMSITDLTKFEYPQVEVQLDGTFKSYTHFKTINVKGTYKSSGQLAKLIPVNGEGSYTSIVTDMEITVTGKLSSNVDGMLFLKNSSFVFQVGNVDFEIDGLEGGTIYNQLVSSIVSDSAARFINMNIPLFDRFVSKHVQRYMNPILNQYTSEELLDFINNLE